METTLYIQEVLLFSGYEGISPNCVPAAQDESTTTTTTPTPPTTTTTTPIQPTTTTTTPIQPTTTTTTPIQPTTTTTTPIQPTTTSTTPVPTTTTLIPPTQTTTTPIQPTTTTTTPILITTTSTTSLPTTTTPSMTPTQTTINNRSHWTHIGKGGGGGRGGISPALRVYPYLIAYEPLFTVSPPWHLRKNRCSPMCATGTFFLVNNDFKSIFFNRHPFRD